MKSNGYFKKVIMKWVVSLILILSIIYIFPTFILADVNINMTDDTIGEYNIYVYPSTCLDDLLIPLILYEDESVVLSVLTYTCSSHTPKIKTAIGYVPITLAYKIGILDNDDFKESESNYILYHEKMIVKEVQNSVSIIIEEIQTDVTIWHLTGNSLQEFKDIFLNKTFTETNFSMKLEDTKYRVYVYDSEENEYLFFINEDGIVVEYLAVGGGGS